MDENIISYWYDLKREKCYLLPTSHEILWCAMCGSTLIVMTRARMFMIAYLFSVTRIIPNYEINLVNEVKISNL